MARRFPALQANYLGVATDVALLKFDNPDATFSWSARVIARSFIAASRNVVLAKYLANVTYLLGTLTSSGVNYPSHFMIQGTGSSGKESTVTTRPLHRGMVAQIGGEQDITNLWCAAWHNDVRALQTAYTGGVVNNTGSWRIGSHGLASGSGNCWDGDIQDVAMWTTILTRDERRRLAEGVSPLEIQRAKLVGYWPLSEPDGDAHDFSGNGNTMVQNGTVFSAPDLPAPMRPVIWIPEMQVVELGSPPVNTVAPVASGTPEVGQTLSCTTGTWTGSPTPTLTYQWQYYRAAVWSNIAAATSNTWVVTVAGAVDLGDSIRCVVTGTNSGGTADGNSNTLGLVTGVDFANQYLGVSVS